MEGSQSEKRSTVGLALSLVAGILVLGDGLFLLATSSTLKDIGMDALLGIGLPPEILGSIGVACAIVIFIGAWLTYLPRKGMLGGILVVVFSIASIVTLGGFFVGMILGIVGGTLSLAKK